MNRLAEDLSRASGISGTDARRLADEAAGWSERRLAAGEVLWYEADPADELALVLEGRAGGLDRRAAHLAARARASWWARRRPSSSARQRTAAVRALAASRLLMLPQAGLAALRRENTRRLRRAARARAASCSRERIESTLAQLAKAAGEVPAPAPRRRARAVDARAPRRRRRRAAVARPGAAPAAGARRRARRRRRRHRGGDGAGARARKGTRCSSRATRETEFYVLAEGRLEVFRRVPPRRGLRLATLLPGALVGTGRVPARARRATPRASPPATSGSSASSRDAFDRLGGEAGRAAARGAAVRVAGAAPLDRHASWPASSAAGRPRACARSPARRVPGRRGRRARLPGRRSRSEHGVARDAAVPRRGRAGRRRQAPPAGLRPRVDHRRRRGDRDALRHRCASPTRTTPPPGAAWRSSRTSSATR